MAKQPNPSNNPIVESIPLDAHGRPMAEYPDADSAIDWTRVDYGKLVDPADATTGRTRLDAHHPKGPPVEHPLKTWRRPMVLLFIAVIAVIAIAILRAQKTPVVSAFTASPANEEPPLAFDQLVRRQTQIAKAENELTLSLFRIEIERAKTVHLANFAVPLEEAAEGLSNPYSLKDIIYLMASDKIKNESKAEEYVNARVAPIGSESAKSLGAILDVADRKLAYDLRVNTTRLAHELAAISRGDAHANGVVKSKLVSEQDFKNELQHLGFSAVGIGIGITAAPAGKVLRHSSTALSKRLVAMAGRLFGKQVTRAAGSAALPVLDGPLPLGEFLAAVGIAWTTYEVYSMKNEFHDEVQATLMQSLSQTTESACAQAIATATKREQQYAKLQAQMSTQTLQQGPNGRT